MVANKVADSIVTGGQMVKDNVVEGAELVVSVAKPKIKHSLRTIAWQVSW